MMKIFSTISYRFNATAFPKNDLFNTEACRLKFGVAKNIKNKQNLSPDLNTEFDEFKRRCKDFLDKGRNSLADKLVAQFIQKNPHQRYAAIGFLNELRDVGSRKAKQFQNPDWLIRQAYGCNRNGDSAKAIKLAFQALELAQQKENKKVALKAQKLLDKINPPRYSRATVNEGEARNSIYTIEQLQKVIHNLFSKEEFGPAIKELERTRASMIAHFNLSLRTTQVRRIYDAIKQVKALVDRTKYLKELAELCQVNLWLGQAYHYQNQQADLSPKALSQEERTLQQANEIYQAIKELETDLGISESFAECVKQSRQALDAEMAQGFINMAELYKRRALSQDFVDQPDMVKDFSDQAFSSYQNANYILSSRLDLSTIPVEIEDKYEALLYSWLDLNKLYLTLMENPQAMQNVGLRVSTTRRIIELDKLLLKQFEKMPKPSPLDKETGEKAKKLVAAISDTLPIISENAKAHDLSKTLTDELSYLCTGLEPFFKRYAGMNFLLGTKMYYSMGLVSRLIQDNEMAISYLEKASTYTAHRIKLITLKSPEADTSNLEAELEYITEMLENLHPKS